MPPLKSIILDGKPVPQEVLDEVNAALDKEEAEFRKELKALLDKVYGKHDK